MVWSGRLGNQKRSVNWSAIFIIGSKPKSTISFDGVMTTNIIVGCIFFSSNAKDGKDDSNPAM